MMAKDRVSGAIYHRGRELAYASPPAQIPACAITHGAPASDDDEGERFQYGKLVEKHAKMTHEEANWRLILTQPSDYSNSFSSGNEGKATRDDLHRKDWDGSSRRRCLPTCPPSWRWVTVGLGK